MLVSHLAATEDAVDATNKLVDNSTLVKLQDSEILAVNNQVEFQAEDANQLSTSHQQSSPAQTKSPKFQSTLPKPLSTTYQKPVPKSWESKSPQGLSSNQTNGIKPTVVIHMCAVLQARVDLASNKGNMLKSDNVWLAGDAVN
ncbi:hypothetical protein DSO57_1031598 [Entomophthora muscae]|uniref:Uncharacterized protein n=1 Tax=Entomophthora muscae TaxID=34485 RepID=A0ACC2SD87_9FUNG|nr:hypothetical protein DSO57_1031598 [Entomophthora muscae]